LLGEEKTSLADSFHAAPSLIQPKPVHSVQFMPMDSKSSHPENISRLSWSGIVAGDIVDHQARLRNSGAISQPQGRGKPESHRQDGETRGINFRL
jgi:hypothetical protein